MAILEESKEDECEIEKSPITSLLRKKTKSFLNSEGKVKLVKINQELAQQSSQGLVTSVVSPTNSLTNSSVKRMRKTPI